MNEKLTAYVLNELPPDERAEFEAQMKTDPALRQQAEEMKVFCAMLSEEVANDESPALTSQQRVSVMRAFTTEAPDKKIVRPFWRHPALLVPAAIAACVAFAMVWDTRLTESGFAPDAVQASQEKVLAENVQVSQAKAERKAPAPSAPKPAPVAPAKPRTEMAAAPAPVLPSVAAPEPPKGAVTGDQTRVMQVADSKLEASAPAAPAAAGIPASPAPSAPAQKQIVASANAPASRTAAPAAKDVAGMPLAAAQKPSLQKEVADSPAVLSRSVVQLGPHVELKAKPNYASQWLGTFTIRAAGAYTFSAKAGESCRVSIDGVLVLNCDGTKTGNEISSMPVQLAAGSHEMRVESASNAGALIAGLAYAGPDTRSSGREPPTDGQYAQVAMISSNAGLKAASESFLAAIERGNNLPRFTSIMSLREDAHLPNLSVSNRTLPGTHFEGGAIATTTSDNTVGILGSWAITGKSDGTFNTISILEGAGSTAPAPVTAAQVTKVQEVELNLEKAYSFYNLGDYHNSIKTFQDVLRIDPYNHAARRGMERAEQKRSEYFDMARNHLRAKMLNEVNKGWEDPIPASLIASTGTVGFTTNLGRGVATINSLNIDSSGANQLAEPVVIAPSRYTHTENRITAGGTNGVTYDAPGPVLGKDVNYFGFQDYNGVPYTFDNSRTSGTTTRTFTVNPDAYNDADYPSTTLGMGGDITGVGQTAAGRSDGGKTRDDRLYGSVDEMLFIASTGGATSLASGSRISHGASLEFRGARPMEAAPAATLSLDGASAPADNSAGPTKVGSGTLELAGANTYTGATLLNSGTISVANANVIGDSDGDKAKKEADSSTALHSTKASTSVNKSGTGTWTLDGANTYSGTTTISGGTLIAGEPASAGLSGRVFGDANNGASSSVTHSGNVSGNISRGDHATALRDNSAIAVPGTSATTRTFVNGGTLELQGGTGSVTLSNDLTVIQNNPHAAAEITASVVDSTATRGIVSGKFLGSTSMADSPAATPAPAPTLGLGNLNSTVGALAPGPVLATDSPTLQNGIIGGWAVSIAAPAPAAARASRSQTPALALTLPAAPAPAADSFKSTTFDNGRFGNQAIGSISAGTPTMNAVTRTVDLNGNITISPALPTITAPLVDNPTVTIQIAPGPPSEQELRERELARMSEREAHLRRHLMELEQRNAQIARRNTSNETYTRIYENPFLFTQQQPLSTFSIDVDTASYANVRRFLNQGQAPPPDAVRLEELINYFPYSYEGPSDGKPFGVMVDVADAPWQPLHRLVRVALKGREVKEERGQANFVFLVDVSGSMGSEDKLPLVKRSLEMLTRALGKDDRVAMVVYAGSSGLVLPSTPGTERDTILEAIGRLQSGGSTNGAGGITQAYQEAAKNFIKGGVNRVILCTDGDFNVGISSPEQLEKLIAEKAKSRIFLSVLGFGTGNLKDRTMETLADKGNGNYAYIDSLSEARKVLVEQMNGTLVTIAKDVKIQVEFNPTQVAAYRLLGYENRLMAKEDFNNDKKDAGEIGAGHTVTALYEVVPARVRFPDGRPAVDELKYAPKAPQPAAENPALTPDAAAPARNELMTVKLRYKQPEGDKSDLLEVPVTDKEAKLSDAPKDFQFAASVAGFGMLLRGSQHAGELNWDMVRDMALHGKGEDALGYRGEFLQLIDKARGLMEVRR